MKKTTIIPAAILSAALILPFTASAQQPDVNPDIQFSHQVSDFIKKEQNKNKIRYLGQSDGYESVMDWYNDLNQMKADAVGIADEAIAAYSSVITDEERDTFYYLEDRMVNAVTMDIYNESYEMTNDLMDMIESRMPKRAYSGGYYGGPEGVLTKAGGVNSFGGRRETWYSSRVLYHYRTGEWWVDANGVYRDADGYVVVAASDLPQGSTVDTSHGMGKVYDSGCAAGTTDIYTNW